MSNNPDFGKTGNSIWNQPFIDYIQDEVLPNMNLAEVGTAPAEFLELYPKWIQSSKLNNFTGLDTYPDRYVSLGTTQALEWWQYWCIATGQNLKVFRGEYPYNRDVWLGPEMNWSDSIDDTGLSVGDAVIISIPFSGNGRKHERWDWLIEECTAKNIPILVDCAWFGTCFDIDVDLSHDCIKMVAFSTGKGLSGGNWRAGIVFSRLDEERCGMRVQTEWNHGIHLNVALSNALMKKFSPDTMPNKYREAHKIVCEHYGLQETNTIHIAQAPDTPEWDMFHRDRAYNRINLAKALKRYKNNGKFAE